MKVLLLAGTAEARALAGRLAGDARFDLVASLAGATRAPEAYAVPVRSGGFGGTAGLEKYIEDNDVEAIVDVTHPFARVMPQRAQALCARHGRPYLRLARPGWTPEPGDRWRVVKEAVQAAEEIAPGARVFLATGARSLGDFAALAAGRYVVARVIDPPDRPFPFLQGQFLIGRPPFTVAGEIATFRAHGIDVLVAKNAGGPADAKLAAARALGLPVVLLNRPPPPPGDRVESVAAALAWLERLA